MVSRTPYNAKLGHSTTNTSSHTSFSHNKVYSTIQHRAESSLESVRVSFKLHTIDDVPVPDKFLSVDTFVCQKRSDLPPSFAPTQDGRLFDFTTTVSTDLKLIFMGDSLGHQFSQGFDAAVLEEGHESRRNVMLKYQIKRKIFDCLTISAPTRGGGVSAFWRFTKLLQRGKGRKSMACSAIETGWGQNFALRLLDYQYSDDSAPNSANIVSGFDAAILRIPHGWMKAEEITRERLVEAINFCNEVLGVRTVVITTIAINNNAMKTGEWDEVTKTNVMIQNIQDNWKQPNDGEDGVEWVLLQQFSSFTLELIKANAEYIGYDVSNTDYLFDQLAGNLNWPQAIPMVCANKPRDNLVTECHRNKISPDGIHWCVETIGPRYTASVACLLGCIYNGRTPERTTDGLASLRRCEHDCNEQFMTLKRVDEEWIGNGRTIFSESKPVV